MKTSMRPKMLGHLKEMIQEQDQEIVHLRAKLQAYEAMKGEPMDRLEQMRSLDGSACFSKEDTIEELQETQRVVNQLQEQLAVSNAGRLAIAAEAERWQAEAEALQKQAIDFQNLLAESKKQIRMLQESQQSVASTQEAREVEALKTRLAQAVEKSSMLGSQLVAREADVARLERRVAALEGNRSDVLVNNSSFLSDGTVSAGSLTAGTALNSSRNGQGPRSLSLDNSYNSRGVSMPTLERPRPRLTNSTSASELVQVHHHQVAPQTPKGLFFQTYGGGAPPPRSQSVPVQTRRMVSAPPVTTIRAPTPSSWSSGTNAQGTDSPMYPQQWQQIYLTQSHQHQQPWQPQQQQQLQYPQQMQQQHHVQPQNQHQQPMQQIPHLSIQQQIPSLGGSGVATPTAYTARW
eukprot:TRINITY_DN9114_c0_g1_i1.p1 TRINITY_DN9114_c0_g1~~TRINITY_DN9114_c0_g1_i1.p1  ORF type:complete len:405 (+),score=85.34 TRINITY_DN9114_c0_g1_i1:71-1285(+)